MQRPDLPKDFLFGTATASYQVEGASEEDGRTSCIWDDFAKVPGAVYKQQDGKVSVDQYHRYKDDIKLMARLGFQSYRFSVSWSRVLPHGGTEVNQKGIEYYRNLCNELHKYGLTACCTIYHWDLPSEIQAEGGWNVRSTAYKLAYLSEVLFRELGDVVDSWITINESLCITFYGHLTGTHAPGIRDYNVLINAIHHVNLAHGLIVQKYKESGLKAPIGITLNLETPRPASKRLEDKLACDHHRAVKSESFLGPIIKGEYPKYITEELKWNLPIEEGDMQLISQKIDFIGVNYYFEQVLSWSDTRLFNIKNEPRFEQRTSGIGWSITPMGLYRLLKWIAEFTEGKIDIIVTENGASCDDKLEEDGSVHDRQRIDYLATHLDACAKAIKDGVPLKGYYCWSFIDNYEWSHGYSKRFGIVYCDYKTLARYPKDSAYYLRDVMAGYGDY